MDINSYVISSTMIMAQAKIEQEMKISVMKKIIDAHEAQSLAMAEMINSVPSVERLLDIYA